MRKYKFPADVLNVGAFLKKSKKKKERKYFYSEISRANWSSFIAPTKKII
ncbi:hypothetical protein [Tenacibaculum sp. Bg11-29]|nr:hypothetical protein [Tenacibaculum sp. Bg11-29]